MTAMVWEPAELREVTPPVAALTEGALAEERDLTVQLAVDKALDAVEQRFAEASETLVTRNQLKGLLTEAVATYAARVEALEGVNAELRAALIALEQRPPLTINVPPTQQRFEITTPAVKGGDIHVHEGQASTTPPAWWKQPKETMTEVIESDREGMPTKTRTTHSY